MFRAAHRHRTGRLEPAGHRVVHLGADQRRQPLAGEPAPFGSIDVANNAHVLVVRTDDKGEALSARSVSLAESKRGAALLEPRSE